MSAFALLFYFFIFFSSSLGERGETSPRWHPPSCGNGFPGPLLCQLLAAVVLQSKRCRNPFFGQCLWLRMLPPLCVHVRVCVCVCVTEQKMGCGWEKLSSIHMHMHFICLHAVHLAVIWILTSVLHGKWLIATTAGTMPKLFQGGI